MRGLIEEILKEFDIDFNRKQRKALKKIYKKVDTEAEELKASGIDINDPEVKKIFIEEVHGYVRRTLGYSNKEDIDQFINSYEYEEDEEVDDKKKKVQYAIGIQLNKGRQELAVRNMFCFDTLFGGSTGGGKTMAILLRILFIMSICVEINRELKAKGLITGGARFLILRRDLAGLRDLQIKSFEVFSLIGGYYTKNNWSFEIEGNVFSVELGYIRDEKSFGKYQGQEYIGVYVDEAGLFFPDEFNNIAYVRSRRRSPQGFPYDFMMTANPGGPGHLTLQEMYDIPKDGNQDIKIIKTYNGKILKPGDPKFDLESKDDEKIRYRMFIPSTIKDNPFLSSTDYVDMLRYESGLSDKQIANLIDGKWSIDSSGMFDDVFSEQDIVLDSSITKIPNTWTWFRGYDFGTASPYAGLVFAKNNGRGNMSIDGKEKITPIGTTVVVNMVYGGGRLDPSKPFKGDDLPVDEQAKRINKMEDQVIDQYNLDKINPGFADDSIYTNGIHPKSPEGSTSEILNRYGLKYIGQKRPPGSRAPGWMKIRMMMRNSIENRDEPHLYIMDCCQGLILETRAAQQNKSMNGDIDDNADHALDVLRYNVHTPKTKKKQAPNYRMNSKFG